MFPIALRVFTCSSLLLMLAACHDGGHVSVDPPQEPLQTTVHFTLHGMDSAGGIHPVAGSVRIEQRDAVTGELVAEFVGAADASGKVAVMVGEVSQSDAYVLTASVPDEWYFAPESVTYFFGRTVTGAQLQAECTEPCALSFRSNEAIAYLRLLGTVEQFREQFPTERGEKPVYEVTLVVRGLREQLLAGPCDYYMEDFYFWDEAIDDFFAYRIREVFQPIDCASVHTGRFLVAIPEEYVAQPGFGTDLLWDSMVYMEGDGDTDFALVTQSRLYYIGETLFGLE